MQELTEQEVCLKLRDLDFVHDDSEFVPSGFQFRYYWLPKDRKLFANHSSHDVHTCNRPCHQSLLAEPERHLICGRVYEAGPLNEQPLRAEQRTAGGAY